jgi:hypothetical protein
MRLLNPKPRGTVYISTAALPLNVTLVDVKPADLFPVNRTTAVSTTRGWINLNR